MTKTLGCSIDEIKDLVLFMKRESVESFEVGGIKVTFNQMLSDITGEIADNLPQEDEDDLLFAST